MILTEPKEKLNSSKSESHKAKFEEYNFKKEKFIYFESLKKRINGISLNVKRWLNSIIQGQVLLVRKFNWKKATKDFLLWVAEALIEGIVLNFWLHFIFGAEFKALTALAYGALIKQSKDLIVSLIKDIKRAMKG